MPYSNSQEETIYRRLAGKIQLGFYSDGERFPSALEIARQFHVSYCPAQRALKALDREGYIKVCRGKETVVIAKPSHNYLNSPVFKGRLTAMADLVTSLRLITPAISCQGMRHLDLCGLPKWETKEKSRIQKWREMYGLFEKMLEALGSQTIRSLYYDIGAFIESSFVDMFGLDQNEEQVFLNRLWEELDQGIKSCSEKDFRTAKIQMKCTGNLFLDKINRCLDEKTQEEMPVKQETFSWAPHKGRRRYCDLIAIDLLCKINRGVYPDGTRLPNCFELGDTYHVSAITIRRTVSILNDWGVTKSVNGVGTYVCMEEKGFTVQDLKADIFEEDMRTFIETLQLITITCEDIVKLSFPKMTEEWRQAIRTAVSLKEPGRGFTATISSCMQGIVHCCPLNAVREIYGKISLPLLSGNVIQLKDFNEEDMVNWKALSGILEKTVDERDEKGFALAFRWLMGDTFCAMKSYLTKIGVTDLERIVTPVFENSFIKVKE